MIRDAVAAIERLSAALPPLPQSIPVVHLWSGKDNETSAALDERNASCPLPPTYQRDWLAPAGVVPARCL